MPDVKFFQCRALIRAMYRFRILRGVCIAAARRIEGGEFYSATLRDILRLYHGVTVGAYSYGECMRPSAFPAGVVVGSYVSIAPGVRVFLRNHPTERVSTHPFFYNHHLGWLERDSIETGTLCIGHDAWIGERAIITPGCREIGIGAVVGAGSVVTRDVPAFAIVAGSPARLIRYRFDEDVRNAILESKWWERPIEELAAKMDSMTSEIGSVADILAGLGIARGHGPGSGRSLDIGGGANDGRR